jgi:hypothetical protein
MKVAIEHVFAGIHAAAYETLFFDEPFNEALGTHLHMGRKLLRLEIGAERIVRHIRYEPAHDPESPATQAFGTSRASFLEELDYDVRSRRGAWRTIPNLWAERVRNSGTIEFADVAEGTKRLVRGEVTVKAFGFGKLVEKMIVAEIDKSYAASAAFTRDWLAKR